MKRLLPIFELSKNEQRIVLIVMLALVIGAFAAYERRTRHFPSKPIAVTEPKPSLSPPSPVDAQ
jgi:hypothetical protein